MEPRRKPRAKPESKTKASRRKSSPSVLHKRVRPNKDQSRVSEQKQVEEELEKSRKLERNLLAISRILPLCKEYSEAWEAWAGLITKSVGAMAASMYLPDEEKKCFRLISQYGLSEDYAHQINKASPLRITRETVLGTAFLTKRPVFSGDVDTDPKFAIWRKIARKQGYRSMIGVPLLHEKACLGVACFYYEQPRNFEQEEIDLLRLAVFQLTPELVRIGYDKKIRESEDLFRKYFELGLVGMAVTSLEKGWIHVNDRLCEILGYTRKELLGMTWSELTYPEDLEPDLVQFNRVIAGEIDGYSMDKRFIRKDGRIIFATIHVSCVRRKDGSVEHFIAHFQDITERKNMERNLNEQKTFLNDILESIQDGISILDNGLNIIFTNNTMKKWYAHNLPHIGRKCFDVYHGRTKQCEVCPSIQALKSGKESLEIVPKTGVQGVEGWMELYAFPLVDSGTSEVTGVIEYVRDVTERRRVESALRESEEKFRTIFESSPLGILHFDQDGVVTIANDQVLKILGANRERLIGFNTLKGLKDPLMKQAMMDALSGRRGTFEGEYVSITGGKRIIVKTECSPVFAEDGSSLGGMAVFEDISKRKKAEEAVLKIARGVSAEVGERYFRSMVLHLTEILEADYAFIGEVAGDKQQRVRTLALCAGGEVLDNFEYDLAGTPCDNVVGRDPCSYTDRVFELFPEDHLLAEMHVNAYVGIPLYDSSGKSLGLMVVMYKRSLEDVRMIESTLKIFGSRAASELERNMADGALRDSERSYRTLAQNLPAMVYRTFLKENNRMQFFNEMCKTMTGYSEEELCGGEFCTIDCLMLPEEKKKVLAEISSCVKEKRAFSVEYRARHKNGTIRYFLEKGTPVYGPDGKPLYVDGLIYDMTENKRMEEELSRAQRLETAGRIAGQIAHDFNNLLSPLMAYPDLMRMEFSDKDHPVMPLLDQMQSAAIQMAEINQQLLTLGRRGHYTLEAVHLNTVIQELLESFPVPHTVTVEKKYDPGLLPVKGGSAQLTRVFTNIIANAIESMADVGTLRIATMNVYLEHPLKSYETIQRGEYARVDIEDNGCGILPEIMNSIFDPFFTTKKADKKRGSGLGLSVVKAVMEDHNGYIAIESRPGKGTTFSFYFPITRDMELLEKPAEEIAGGSERVMVADDDPLQRDVITRLLGQLGYKVHAVESGEEAVEYVRGNPQDLLILDMIMGGIDGTETFRRIREFSPDQKAVILSGYAETGRVAEAQRMGAGSFVRKPVDLKSLARAVRLELEKT